MNILIKEQVGKTKELKNSILHLWQLFFLFFHIEEPETQWIFDDSISSPSIHLKFFFYVIAKSIPS